MNVVAPVNGVVKYIDEDRITIYISPSDDHKIFSPIDGKITYISITNGYWERHYYKTIYSKTGHLSIHINNQIKFWVEVGKPKYITDTIRVDVSENDIVKQSQILGEILIGSLAEISLPPNCKIKNNIKEGSKIEGGKTILFNINENDGFLKEKVILLTVPHGYCKNDSNILRRCDRRAISSAENLESILKLKTNIKIITVKSEVDRQDMDENRIQSRHDNFRNTIDTVIENYDVIWTIDMHSFPMGGFEPTKWEYLKFVILDDVSFIDQPEHSIFNFNYPYYELLQGSRANDIEEESRSLGIPSILIEVLENNLLKESELNAFLTTIADKILQHRDLKEIYSS